MAGIRSILDMASLVVRMSLVVRVSFVRRVPLLGLAALAGTVSLVSFIGGATRAQPSVGGLSLQAPERVVLGEEDSIEISARIPDGQRVRFFANVGEIASSGDADGRALARYTPPSARFPQIAIVVAATDDLAVVDWVAIPLHGSATVSVAYEARSRVVVSIGGREFGPVNTGSSGVAEVRLVVPPGVRQAHAVGRDRLGNSTEQAVPLNPPPFDRALALCLPDGVLQFVLDGDGTPLPSAEFEARASSGELSAPRALGPGVFYASYRGVDGATLEETVDLSAAIDDETESCQTIVRRAPPDRILLTLGEDHVAEGVASVDVTIELEYPDNALRLLTTPALATAFGTVSEVQSLGEGRFRARWLMPAEFPDSPRATIEASADPGLQTSASLRLEQPRGPFNIGISAGFLTNFARVDALYAALSLTYAAPVGRHSLLLGVRGGFWRSSNSSVDQSGTEPVDLRLLALPVLARVGYRLEFDIVDAFATLDGGIVIANARVQSTNTGTFAESSIGWALGGTLGVALPLGPGALGLELGYLHSPMAGEIQGNTAGLHVALGYTLELPPQ